MTDFTQRAGVGEGELLWRVPLQPDRHDGPVWSHWRWPIDEAEAFTDATGLDPSIAEALTVGLARPRVVRVRGGVLVVLRGVNLNAGAEPDDMVSVRVFADKASINTVEMRLVRAVRELRDRVQDGEGPRDAATFLVSLTDTLADNIRPIVDALQERVADLEEEVLEAKGSAVARSVPERIADIRRSAVMLRRYLAPQRDAVRRLPQELDIDGGELADEVRELVDRSQRYVEDIEVTRERAVVLGEEIDHRLSMHMNRLTYLFSVVAVVFLPLGFVTGLLGINVGGIPLSESGLGFVWICLLLSGLLGFELWLLRRLKML